MLHSFEGEFELEMDDKASRQCSTALPRGLKQRASTGSFILKSFSAPELFVPKVY
jgi:hypothetical protein